MKNKKVLNDKDCTFTKFYTIFYGCQEFDSILQASIYAYIYMFTLRKGRCNTACSTFMRKFYISKMTVLRVIKELESKGLISITLKGRKTYKGWIKGYTALKDPSEFHQIPVYQDEYEDIDEEEYYYM